MSGKNSRRITEQSDIEATNYGEVQPGSTVAEEYADLPWSPEEEIENAQRMAEDLRTEMDDSDNPSTMFVVADDLAIMYPVESQFRDILAMLSRCSDKQYEPMQYGDCTFTLEQIILTCYRVEFPETDAEIAKRMSKLVKKGFYRKIKRGTYQATELLTSDPLVALRQIRREFSATKNPTRQS